MQYAIGPFVPTVDPSFPDGLFALPAGVQSALELHGPDTAVNPFAVFRADNGVRLSRDLTVLGDDARSRDAIESIFGRRPQGSTLEQWLVDMLRSGDPDGLDRCFPSMPMVRGILRFRFGEYLRDEPFRFGQHPHTSQVQAVLQRDFRRMATAELSRSGKANHSRRVLDYWCDKYRLDKSDPAQWRMLVPADLRLEIEGPLRHETTLTESFTKADGAGWGPTLTWVQGSGGIAVVSNQGALGPSSGSQGYHTNTVSSTDHYSECDIVTRVTSATSGVGPGCRHTGTSTNTMYYVRLKGSSNDSLQMYRFNSGSATELQTDTGVTISGTNRTTIEADGDQITADYQGTQIISLTNNNITTGVCGAIRGNESVVDNYEISDLAAPAEGSGLILGIGTITGTGADAEGSGVIEGEGSITGFGSFTEGTGQIEGIGSLTGAGPVSEGSGEIEGSGSLSGTGPAAEGSGEITGEGSLTGAGEVTEAEGSGVIAGEGSLSGAGNAAEGSGSIVGEGSLTGAGIEDAGSGLILGIGSLSGAGVAVEGSGVIAGIGLITGVGADPVTPPVEIPDTAWQYWGPILLMQDDAVSFARAVGMSSRIHGAVVLERVSVRGAVVIQSIAARSTVQ